MIKVINFELKKYFQGKALLICLLVVLIVPILEFSFMQLTSSLGSGKDITEDLINMFLSANGDQIFKYLYYVLFNGGSIFVVATVMVSIAISEDYTQGTMKYTMALSSRNKLAYGKVSTIMILATLINFVGVIIVGLIAVFSRGTFFGLYTFNQIALFVIIGWSVTVAYSLLVAVISSLVNNVPASIGIGLGVYLAGWGLTVYLPERLREYIFICGAMQIGSTDMNKLLKAVLVSVLTIIILATVLHRLLRKKNF